MKHLSTSVEIAAELRCRARQKRPPFSTTKIVQVCFPKALVTGGKLPDNVDEIVSRDVNGPVIIYARRLSPPEQRFAIAHAIAHLMFDGEEACIRPGSAGVPEVEDRADAFAAELLVPLCALRPLVTRWPARGEDHEIYLDQVDVLASRFGVLSAVVDSQIQRLRVTHNFVSHI